MAIFPAAKRVSSRKGGLSDTRCSRLGSTGITTERGRALFSFYLTLGKNARNWQDDINPLARSTDGRWQFLPVSLGWQQKSMPTRNINLTEHFERFIRTEVQSGRYSNASEVVREGLRLMERRHQEER